MRLQIIYLRYVHKDESALNILQWSIYQKNNKKKKKNKQNQTRSNSLDRVLSMSQIELFNI